MKKKILYKILIFIFIVDLILFPWCTDPEMNLTNMTDLKNYLILAFVFSVMFFGSIFHWKNDFRICFKMMSWCNGSIQEDSKYFSYYKIFLRIMILFIMLVTFGLPFCMVINKLFFKL